MCSVKSKGLGSRKEPKAAAVLQAWELAMPGGLLPFLVCSEVGHIGAELSHLSKYGVYYVASKFTLQCKRSAQTGYGSLPTKGS